VASESHDLRRLREALAGFVADDVPELLAQARTEAGTRVRGILAEVMAESMLEQAREQATSVAPVASDRHQPQDQPSPPAPDDDEALGYYVYGVLGADAVVPPGLPGVEPSHPATRLVVGDLAALVSRVPLAEFNEERLREHLGDIAWVETMARRHEQVLDDAAAAATVIPMRMCSIYRDASGIEAMLDREAAAMHNALQLLDARSEWGVKLFGLPLPEPPAADTKDAPPGRGAAYLEQRRQAHRRRESAAARLSTVAEEIHARLAGLAARALVIPPQRPEVSGHEGEMVLNGVYLVDNASLALFHETVEALQAEFGPEGIELVATGPWPPYNFVPDAIGVPA
jgi:hypothetical protein